LRFKSFRCYPILLDIVITIKQIEAFIATRPFRQFALETNGGNYVVVGDPDWIKMPPPGFDLIIVFGVDGLVHHLPADAIATAAVYGPEPGKR